jgi:integrase/recombinase XerD
MTKWFEGTRKILPKYQEKESIETILNRAHGDDQRNYLMLRTLWETGIRVSELTHLCKKDIKDDILMIRLGKGSKDRIVPVNRTLKDLLTYYSAQLTLEDKLFPISSVSVRNVCKKYQGEVKLHPHVFRHSFSVYYLKSGGNIKCLQKILGHNSLTTTSVYLDLIGDDVKDDYKKIQW